ncbi:MAG: dihydrodipicolinate synthase family protein [Bryobacteraceae bacterium]|nr:dihydrodipicolinate synthase family protein [Bryobacteraceae bacterium]MDW8380356.1 dihydrodipicolinate synthase family protein [Bryobacterales bacterium]
MTVTWSGVFPALTTQFHPDESLDLDSTARHLERLIGSGIHGVILLGSVGENTAHDYEEKLLLLRELKAAVRGRIPVLSGVAEFTTAAACRYARDCERIGIDGLMVLPAMVYPADRREAIAHFRSVARACSLPVMIYNNPPSYQVDVTPDMFRELAEEPNIVAIKESSGDPRRITDLINELEGRFLLFCGVDDLVLESVMLGATGWVSGLANAFPEENRVLWELIQAGRWTEARQLYRWYTPLLHLDTKPKLVQYIKLCMAETGLGSETTRAPRLRLEGAERDQVLQVIRRALATRPDLKVYSQQ